MLHASIHFPRARLSPVKDDLLIVEITREAVEHRDIQPILETLSPLSVNQENAIRWEGCVTFCFAGWDGDARETAEIPEIREYFGKLADAWPYWLHYAEKVGDTVPHVLRLLCAGHIESAGDGLVGWRFDDMSDFKHSLFILFERMNELHDRFGFSEEVNVRISEEVLELLTSVVG